MNNWVEIARLTKLATVKIYVILSEDNSILSEGSGCIVSKTGTVVTAKHVIDEYTENKERCKLLVAGSDKFGIIEYGKEHSIQFSVMGVSKDIDFAVILPLTPISTKHCFIAALDYDIKEGESVLMCGYSEETNMNQVFDVDKLAEASGVPLKNNIVKNVYDFHRSRMNGTLLKSGIIAKETTVNYQSTTDAVKKYDFTIQHFHVDNVCNKGMSGGPIVNVRGELIGLITMRNTVSGKVKVENVDDLIDFYIHAGSSMGISISALKMFR